MWEQYVHTLVPRNAHFSPNSGQIARYLRDLAALGAVPLESQLVLHKPSGRIRMFTDPLTGESKSFPASERSVLQNIDDLASTIAPLDEYSVALEGKGPPHTIPFLLFNEAASFPGTYNFVERCCLRKTPVSMSDLNGMPLRDEVTPFGELCTSHEAAILRHPVTNEIIEISGVGCARFWLEFEFGKWLSPKFEHYPNVLNPEIVRIANQSFETRFVETFHLL